MGTHPNGPSIVSIPGKEEIPLSEWVEKHPEQLGPEVQSFFKGNLPFLFKVLSVRTSLSIQAHPNKVCIKMNRRNLIIFLQIVIKLFSVMKITVGLLK